MLNDKKLMETSEKETEVNLNDPFYSEENIRYLEDKLNRYKEGKLKLEEHNLIEV